MRHEQTEFFSTVSTKHIFLTTGGLHPLRDFTQHLVAHRVAVVVIDRLKEVDIKHHTTQRLVMSLSAFPELFKQLEECSAIQATGQCISRRQYLQFLITFLDLLARLAELRQHRLKLGLLLLQHGDVIETGKHTTL